MTKPSLAREPTPDVSIPVNFESKNRRYHDVQNCQSAIDFRKKRKKKGPLQRFLCDGRLGAIECGTGSIILERSGGWVMLSRQTTEDVIDGLQQ